MPIIDKPLPPPPRESKVLSTDSRFLSASPEPISRNPSTASTRNYQRPSAPSPPSTRPPTEAPPTKAQFTVTYNQHFDAKALKPRNLRSPPAAGPSTGIRMISVPFAPFEKPLERKPTLWQTLTGTGQGSPSDGQSKSTLQKYLMPPALAIPAPNPVDGPSRPRGGAKGKFMGGWKIPNLLPKWNQDSSGNRPANPAGGRVITNLDDPEPEPQDHTLLPPLLPSSPTVYTDDAYPAPRDTYGGPVSTAPSDAGTSVSRRPRRRSRPPPPPPGHRTPRRPTRALPPPASQASWITFGRFGQTPAPSTYQDGGESILSGTWTEGDSLKPATTGERTTYTANRDTLNTNRRTFVTGQSLFIGGPSTGGVRSMDGLSDLASRPATPTRSTRFDTEPGSPGDDPELHIGPPPILRSMMQSTIPSQYTPETPVAETPLDTEPPPESLTHEPYSPASRQTDVTYDQHTEPPSPEDERPRIVVTRAYSGYPATALTDGEDWEQSPVDSTGPPNRDTTYTDQTGADYSIADRDTTYTAQSPPPVPPIPMTMPMTMPIPGRDTTYTTRTEMTDGMTAPSEIATTGGLTRNNTQMSRAPGAVSRSNSDQSGTVERSPTSDTKVSHISDEKVSKRSSPVSPPQVRRRSRPIRHNRIQDPQGRYSRKPFGYFHRYPRRSSVLDPKNLTRASMRRARAAKGRSRASTSSSRTYIPSRIGRIRRLFRDFINLPWRGDSDYYGGTRGITATHHFRGGGNRGGVSIRPRRDSNIPRTPWYRSKTGQMRMDLPRNPGQLQGWQGLRAGLNSPLTDGSDRGTLDRFGHLPASASPFVSPYHMRSPYDEVPPMPAAVKKRTPSPLVPNNLTGGPIHGSPSTIGSKSLKNQHALLDSYGTMSPQLRPPTAAPPTAIPDGYFYPVPLADAPRSMHYRVTTGVPSTAFAPGDYDDEDVDEQVPRGIMIHKPGDPPVWAQFETPRTQHPPLPPPYGAPSLSPFTAPSSPPDAYRKQARPRRSRKQARGLPVTIHATSTIAPSSPRTRGKQATQSTVTTDYAPSQIGAAV